MYVELILQIENVLVAYNIDTYSYIRSFLFSLIITSDVSSIRVSVGIVSSVRVGNRLGSLN